LHGEETGDLLDGARDIADQVLVRKLALLLFLQHLSKVFRVNSEFVNAVHLPKEIRGVLELT
jgi:hypothetical protein